MKDDFGFDPSFFESILAEGKPIEDIYHDYEIYGVGTFRLKFLDTKYLVQGVDYFRPFIRGFFVLLTGLYHVKMTLSFIRQDAGIVTGKLPLDESKK